MNSDITLAGCNRWSKFSYIHPEFNQLNTSIHSVMKTIPNLGISSRLCPGLIPVSAVPLLSISDSFMKIFIHLLAVLGLHCCRGSSVVVASGDYSKVAQGRLLIEAASLLQSMASRA